MPRFYDITGKTFGRWTVLGRGERPTTQGSGGVFWRCQCSCGTIKEVVSNSLRRGLSTSCGCLQDENRHARLLNLHGQRFGFLTAVDRAPSGPNRETRWNCLCDCGNTHVVDAQVLKSGKSKSCGCMTRTMMKRAHSKPNRRTADGKRRPEYITWKGIKARCCRPSGCSFNSYGARGITMCQEWQDSYDAFFEHVGPRPSPDHTIDRIDVNKGYEPGNVRWADWSTQANNKTTTRYIEWNGKRQSITQWSRELFGRPHLICTRLKRGWPLERAMTEKPYVGKNQQHLKSL